MATKKAAATTKKASVKKPVTRTQSTTKVKTTTSRPSAIKTVKAVESRPAAAVAASPVRKSFIGTTLIAALVAEFIGTFLLAAAVIAGQGNQIVVMFALVGIVLTLGGLSGAYVNPALTIGAWVTRRISGMRALGYVIAQVLGAMLALVVLTGFLNGAPQAAADAYQQTSAQLFSASAIPAGKEWFVFFAELLGTLIFGFAVASATRETRERTAAAFTVGIGLFLGLMIAGSGAALVGGTAVLNPAVALAVKGLTFEVWPIASYLFASVIGAVAGFMLYDLLRRVQRVDTIAE